MTKQGTEWTAPGQGKDAKGATILELYRAVTDSGGKAPGNLIRAWQKLGGCYKTTVRLTGLPLTSEDLERIETCEVAR
jgi:hypothetical protein